MSEAKSTKSNEMYWKALIEQKRPKRVLLPFYAESVHFSYLLKLTVCGAVSI